MAKQVKLVINNRNEQVNYDSNGKESGAMASLNQKIAEAFKTFNDTITSNSII